MIKFNGKDFEWEEGLTVKSFLDKNGYNFFSLIVVNGKAIPVNEYENTPIRDGDIIKAIHMHGGG